MRTCFDAQSLPIPPVPGGIIRLLDLDRVVIDPADITLLASAERERNARFATATLRHRDLAVRLWLRDELARSSGMAPGSLVFAIGPHGKPAWPTEPGDFTAGNDAARPWFNLSHSANLAVLGFSPTHEIGVDIECLRSFQADELINLARTIMTLSEQADLAKLAVSARSRAFLTAWTRKEACVKVLGFGLSMPVDSLQVGLVTQNSQVRAPVPGTGADVTIAVTSASLGDHAICSSAWRCPPESL